MNSNIKLTNQPISDDSIIENPARNGKSYTPKLELLETPIIGIESTKIYLANLKYKIGDDFLICPFERKTWAKDKEKNNPLGKPIKEFHKATLVDGCEPGEIAIKVQKFKKQNQLDENGKKIRDPKSQYPNGYLKKCDAFSNDIHFPVDGAVKYLEDIIPPFRSNPAFDTGLTCIPNKMFVGGETFTPTKNKFKAADSVFFEVDTYNDFDINFKIVQDISNWTGLTPTMVVSSGGKSPHCYLCLEDGEEISDEKIRLELQRRVVILFSSDPAINNPNTELRIPGFYRAEKGKEQSIVALNDRRYTVRELFEVTDKIFPHGVTDIHWKEYLDLKKEIPPNDIGRLVKTALIMCSFPEEEVKPKTPIRIKSETKIRDLIRSPERSDTKINSSLIAPFEIFLGKQRLDLINNGLPAGGLGRDPMAYQLSLDFQGRQLTLDRLGIPYTDAYSSVEKFCDNCDPPIPESAPKVWGNASRIAKEHPNIDDSFFLSKYSAWLKETAPDEHQRIFAEVDIQNPNKSDEWKKKETDRQGILHTLPIYEKETTVEIKGEYCASEIIAIAPKHGNLFVKLPMGIGKSTAAKMLLIENPTRDVIMISPTTALGRATAKDLGLEYWADIQAECKRDDCDYKINDRLKSCKRLVITYDSLWRINGRDNKNLILLIDEAEKGFKHLLHSSTVNKNGDRPWCIEALMNLCKNQDEQGVLALVMDANLTSVAKDLALSFLKTKTNINIITKREYPKFPCRVLTALERGRTQKMLEQQTKDTFDAVREGKFIIVATDNKDDGIGIEKQLKKEFPDLKTWRFDSSTSGSEEGKQFAGDIDHFLAKNKTQVFIYSPSMGQGLSSTLTKEYAEAVQRGATEEEINEIYSNWKNLTPYFDAEYGYNYHLDNFEFYQMLGRYRHLIPRNIWVDSRANYDGCSSTDPGVVIRNLLESREVAFTIESMVKKRLKEAGSATDDIAIREKELELLKQIKDGNIPPYLWALSRQQARSNWQIKNRRENLINWLRRCGHEVDSSPIDVDTVKKKDRSEVSDRKRETNQQFAELAITAYRQRGFLNDEELEQWGQKEHLDPVREQPLYTVSIFNKKYPNAILEIAEENEGKTPEERKDLLLERLKMTPEEREEWEAVATRKQVEFFTKVVTTGKEFWLSALTNGWMYQHRNEIIFNDVKENSRVQRGYETTGIYSAGDLKRRTAKHSFISKLGLFDLVKFEEADLPPTEAPQYTWDSPAMKEITKRLMSSWGRKGCRMHFNKHPLTDQTKVITYINEVYNHFGFTLAMGIKTETTRSYVLRYVDEKIFPENYRKVIFTSLQNKMLEPFPLGEKNLAVDLFSSIEDQKNYCQENEGILAKSQDEPPVLIYTQLPLPLHTGY